MLYSLQVGKQPLGGPFIGLGTEMGRDKMDILLSDSYPELYEHN